METDSAAPLFETTDEMLAAAFDRYVPACVGRPTVIKAADAIAPLSESSFLDRKETNPVYNYDVATFAGSSVFSLRIYED